jgi:hypothetical protein
MVETRCPSREQLAAFLAHSLSADTDRTLAQHVRTCATCRAALQAMGAASAAASPSLPPLGSAELPAMSSPQMTVLGELGGYRLLEQLGRGGMGVVYRAWHAELDRPVAVKVLAARWVESEAAVQRFQQELRAVGRLDHPNIVRALDARSIGQTHFLVTEFIAGLDCDDLVRRVGPAPVVDACELIRQAADGLQYIHQQGLVHRDIKPANLMVTDVGVVKILDLGLARVRAVEPANARVTQDGQALGTPDFMAPEQVTHSRDVDVRADLYSLGCTLYFLLTGHGPFGDPRWSTAFQKMSAHVQDPVPPITADRNDIPFELVQILNRLLAKDPDDRFPTPDELLTCLAPLATGSDLQRLVAQGRGVADGVPRAAGTTQRPATTTLKRRSTHRRRTFLIGGVVVALVLALVTVRILKFRRAMAKNSQPSIAASVVTPGVTPGVTPAAVADPPLPGWIVASWTLEGLGRPDLWLFHPDGSRRIQVTDDPVTYDVHPSFSPDGRRIAFIRGTVNGPCGVWVCDANGRGIRELVKSASNSERLYSPVWRSTDRILYARDPHADRRLDMELWEVDLDSGAPHRVTVSGKTPALGNALITDASPDGGLWAAAVQRGLLWASSNVQVIDARDGSSQIVWQDDRDDCKDARPCWSADGQHLAWHHNFTRGVMADTYYYGVGLAQRRSDGQWDVRLQSNHAEMVTPLAWAPDRAQLLCARMNAAETHATFLLMNDRCEVVEELFDLEVHGWQPGQRDFGRLADWSLIPGDVPLEDTPVRLR